MQLVTFVYQSQRHLGALLTREDQHGVLDLNTMQPALPADMLAFLAGGAEYLALARRAIEAARSIDLIPEADIQLLAPVPRPGKIICLGHNYFDHMGQGREAPPEWPTFFCKTSNTIIGPGQPIGLPKISAQVDYEAELAVIIGRPARRVPIDQALNYVAGYTIFNDVSARDIQKRSSQWFLGKSFDTFGPLGPALVTADEVPDPHALELSLTHNGVERQHTNTRDMIFSIPRLIAELSAALTLEPGDVIATGTPARIAEPAGERTYLKPGDVVRIRIERLGELMNPLVAEE